MSQRHSEHSINTRLNKIEERIGNIEVSQARIEGALTSSTGFIMTTHDRLAEHDKEIKVLNKVRWQAMGGAGVVTALLVYLKTLIWGK
jgi:hypothetical protein